MVQLIQNLPDFSRDLSAEFVSSLTARIIFKINPGSSCIPKCLDFYRGICFLFLLGPFFMHCVVHQLCCMSVFFICLSGPHGFL